MPPAMGGFSLCLIAFYLVSFRLLSVCIRGMNIDFQFFINFVVGIVTFFGGWLIKMIYDKLNSLEEDHEELWDHHEEDMKEERKMLNALALSLPEKYVSKDDFNNLVKTVHHRFDRLEEKLDSFKK